jgi:hypothetical protein
MAVSDYSMFDVQAAQEAQRHKTAYEVSQIPLGSGALYASSAMGDLYNEGLMGLAGMLGGTPSPEVGKQQAIAEIQERFPNPDTFEEFMELANAFSMGGFYSFAEAAIKAANETRASMPVAAKTTDFQSNYEYVMGIKDPGQREIAMQLWKPSAGTDDWSNYLKTDTTPTGAEYLEYMNSQGVDATQTTDWKNYVNTTDTPTRAGFAVWIDRNQKLQTFANAEQLELSLLYASPAFLVAPTKEREELIDAIELKYRDIKTFTQHGVVYDAHTSTAMIEGSKEIIPTTIVGGRVYDARTMTLLNDTGVKREMVKREDKKWYYKNGERVFKNDLAISDPELKAAEIYAKPEYKDVVTDESVRISVANELVREGLAGTDVFTNLMSHISEDGTRAIQAENLIVKSIERLGESFVKSGVGTMDSILIPLEAEIAKDMTQIRSEDGTIVWVGDLPGWGLGASLQKFMPGDIGYKARRFAEKAMSLINTVLKQRSGAAVTESEWERLQDEYASGITTAAGFASWVTRIRDYTEKTRMNILGAYQPIVVNRYMANQGIYKVLENPDDPVQRNQIPINGFYQDTDGTIYQRTE